MLLNLFENVIANQKLDVRFADAVPEIPANDGALWEIGEHLETRLATLQPQYRPSIEGLVDIFHELQHKTESLESAFDTLDRIHELVGCNKRPETLDEALAALDKIHELVGCERLEDEKFEEAQA